jgi:hypothetical protein
MREGADKNNVPHSWQARVIAEANETGASAKRNFNRQQEQIPLPAANGGGGSETKMSMLARTPMWYRRWGLNE